MNNIEDLSREELIKLKRRVEEGVLLKKIDDILIALSEDKSFCPVCHKPVSQSSFKLTFGPEDMKMQAKFDALDCLEHFIKNLSKK